MIRLCSCYWVGGVFCLVPKPWLPSCVIRNTSPDFHTATQSSSFTAPTRFIFFFSFRKDVSYSYEYWCVRTGTGHFPRRFAPQPVPSPTFGGTDFFRDSTRDVIRGTPRHADDVTLLFSRFKDENGSPAPLWGSHERERLTRTVSSFESAGMCAGDVKSEWVIRRLYLFILVLGGNPAKPCRRCSVYALSPEPRICRRGLRAHFGIPAAFPSMRALPRASSLLCVYTFFRLVS